MRTLTRSQYADLAVVAALAGLIGWYLLDARSASTDWLNLVLILPVTVIALVLCALHVVQTLFAAATQDRGAEAAGADTEEPTPGATDTAPLSAVLPVMGLFSGYVLSLHWLGFDVGSALFVGLFLWLHGERRLVWLFGYAVCLASLLSLFFAEMLPYPLPMLVLPS